LSRERVNSLPGNFYKIDIYSLTLSMERIKMDCKDIKTRQEKKGRKYKEVYNKNKGNQWFPLHLFSFQTPILK
jgi:hypothetical protein